MSLLDDVKQAVNGWFDAALGKPLDAALAKVRAAVSGRSVEQTVKPEVEAFFSAMTGWDQHLRRLEAAAAQISPPDPQVQAYVAAIRQKRDLLWTQATDPNAARPATSGAPVGFFPAIPAGTAVVFTAICAVAVAGFGMASTMLVRRLVGRQFPFNHGSALTATPSAGQLRPAAVLMARMVPTRVLPLQPR
ncbi:MAG: hypothetical protein JNM72_01420 [Deltaproteobacteria bacterium]|nr:hypothetical protein [Deltaproteobacteria bacterium]